MINLYGAHITSISIHRVGNKINNEPIFLSNDSFHTDDELTPLLKEYFLKPFREKEKNYFQFIQPMAKKGENFELKDRPNMPLRVSL